ncbi:MAG TPA: hypothetical protein VD767_01685, partial [Thermomicrobiales bacterium]|nr:hypothetical protein [Thermomicrobiales bacterium]
MVLTLFLILAILLSWGRTYRPGLSQLHGTVIHVERVPLLARIRMHATAIAIVVGLALAQLILNPGTWIVAVLALISIVVLVAAPVNYTIT